MRLLVSLLGALAVAVHTTNAANVGAYLMLSRTDSSGNVIGLDELGSLAASASTLPITRLYLAFVSPTLTYKESSNTLVGTGLNISTSLDGGFGNLKSSVGKLQAGGVEVFISMGGWNFNCYPFFYSRYSIAGYGTHTPNYWKIQQFGGGNIDNCNESNQWCYTCEPPSEGTTYADFSIFPEPSYSSTWQQAKEYVAQGASASGVSPQWNEDMIPGSQYKDPTSGISTMVPGFSDFHAQQRDPYQDIVYLAKDLGLDGVDLDYEEFWHADTFKSGTMPGPFNLTQTVFKYTAIAYDIATNIKSIQPSLKLSTAAGAVGAWQGNWWGGNLKGLWFYVKQWMPFMMDFMTTGANAGGINVMTYDLSDNMDYHECPSDDSSTCPLNKQVQYYMDTYDKAGIPAGVGYEVSTPAYPDKTHDASHQLPLTTSELSAITSTTQPKHQAGFMWEIYKSVDSSDHATATQVAQAICKSVMSSSPRCTGSFPPPTNTSSNVCSSDSSTCTVCDACCKSYLTPQSVCDQCVSSECKTANICSADSTCNVCSDCCKSYLSSASACNACVTEECGNGIVPRLLANVQRRRGARD